MDYAYAQNYFYGIKPSEEFLGHNSNSLIFKSPLKNKTEKFQNNEIYPDFDSTENKSDTTAVKIDSSLSFLDSLASKADTAKIDSMSIDSTARIKYFHYERNDFPAVTIKQKKQSSFFAQPSPGIISRTIEIDSTGKFVIIREKILGKETKIPLVIPIEEYIKERLDANERKAWEQLAYEYKLKEGKKGLGQLIEDITNFEIPLPSVGVLSIFGPPKISLKIGGAVDIHGAFRSEKTEGVTASLLGNTRNEPDFRQQVQINVNGTIGDKLNISADWNTERTFEYENQLKIKYTGYDDEIIQSIEAGNVSLQTSPLVGGSEALFGLKSKLKLGSFTLTSIATQKKGQIKEVSISNGATSSDFAIRAYNYSKNHYFIDTVYASTSPNLNLFEQYYGSPTPIANEQFRVVDIEVWKSINVTTSNRSNERIANAFIDLPPLSKGERYDDSFRGDITGGDGKSETGRFVLLTPGVDYILHPETGFITFNTQIQDQDIIAVAYQRANGPGTADDSFFGEFLNTASADTSQKLVLKLVKPFNLQPQFKTAWKLLLKNIYPIGGRNIKREGFEFNIEYEVEGQEPVTDFPTTSGTVRLLNAFGLDVLDASQNPNPDNIFDFRNGITIFPETGEIVFPKLEPFGRDLPKTLPKDIAYNSVYDTTVTFAQQDKVHDKWILKGKFSGEASNTYQLGFNVVENSVRVLLNGRELTPNIDYIVDYNIGQLTIRNDAALVAGADLKITFEQNDLFQLASKTMLGARGVFDISDKTKLGFSILNLNQQTLSDKVRIGEEPLKNTIMGVDFSTGGELPFVTKAIDKVISTKAKSSFSVSGEYAYISPDPNTKKSTVASDGGQSIAYIDDFEGAKRIIPVGVTYTGWKDISPPDQIPLLTGLNKREMMDHKAKSFWFTQSPSQVTVKDLFGNRRKASRNDQQISVMDYVFLPDTPGTYNYTPNLSDPKKSWGGVMKVLSSTANNLIEQNVEFIEFWINIPKADPDSKLFIDLGRISEDVIPNNKLDTEDKDLNDVLDAAGLEDTGLDGLTDGQERDPNLNPFLNGVPSTKSDPSGDNFFFQNSIQPQLFDYFNINGTQGNSVLTDIGRLPDTEDLNRNGNVDLVNSYFRYEVPLDTNKATNPFIAGGGDNAGWFLIRIPLKDTTAKVGNPSLSNVEFIRMFTTNVSNMTYLRFAEFNLVGSQWQKVIPEDTVLSVSVVNIEDNPDYKSPPGVFQERDLSKPDENVLRNEQSLSLIVKDLPEKQFRETVKYLFSPLNIFNYREMKLFVHGDEINIGPGTVSSNDPVDYPAEVYFKFGTDTNNFYEYRQPVRPGWDEISIPFDKITALKQNRDSLTQLVKVPVDGKPGHFYLLKGNPTLTSIKFLIVGIYNRGVASSPGPISGDVWVNELRVVGADDSPGWAYNISTSLQLADVMSLNFNYSQQNPFFHRISDRFGSRVETRNWGAAVDVDVLKLLPINLAKSNLRVKYSHNESIGKPLYVPGTDVLVDEAVKRGETIRVDSLTTFTKTPEQIRAESETETISDTWTASNVQIRIPTSFWLVRDVINGITLGFNYNKSFSRSPTVERNDSWVWNFNMNYALNIGQEKFFYPADIPLIGSVFGIFDDYRNVKLYFLPQNYTLNVSARRFRNTNLTRPQGKNPATEIISRDFTTSRGFSFNWKMTEGGLLNLSSTYNLDIKSSLAHLETDQFGSQRTESEIWNDIFSGAFFGRDFQYNQSVSLKSQPQLPTFWNIDRYFKLRADYNVNYQWNYDFRQVNLGRRAGYSSRSSIGLTLRWKDLTAPLFAEEKESVSTKKTTKSSKAKPSRRTRNFEEDLKKIEEEEQINNLTKIDTSGISRDSLIAKSDSTLIEKPKKSAAKRLLLLFKSIARTLFFDYKTFTFNLSSNNNVSKAGLRSTKTGFYNFWSFGFNDEDGPSRSFMLGLNSDIGRRAPNGNLNDVFSQQNSFDFSTSRPLWEGANINLTWKLGWSVNKNTSLVSDSLGNTVITNITSTGTINRSFLSFPPVLFFKSFNSGIAKVNELFDRNAPNPDENLSNAFIQGFESLPITSKLSFFKDVARFIPRPNWRITWDGLEKFPLFKGFATKVSLEHTYSSSYSEGWKLNADGIKEVQTQRVEYGFVPLIGINFTFNKLWGGNLLGSIKYSTRTNFSLGRSTRNITETFSKDIGFTAGFSKSGFELPLFGLNLKNDVEFSFSYTNSKNSTITFNLNNFDENGIPQDGTARTTLEPRIKYTVSSKVTLAIFYRKTTTEPEGASRIPPTTTNEAGLDVHISIQ